MAQCCPTDSSGRSVKAIHYWSGTKADGTAHANNCNDWTSNSDVLVGRHGRYDAVGGQWTDAGVSACHVLRELVCVEGDVGPPTPQPPTAAPTKPPTATPSRAPSPLPTRAPSPATSAPTTSPTLAPSPSPSPSFAPSPSPSRAPSPVTAAPSTSPSPVPLSPSRSPPPPPPPSLAPSSVPPPSAMSSPSPTLAPLSSTITTGTADATTNDPTLWALLVVAACCLGGVVVLIAVALCARRRNDALATLALSTLPPRRRQSKRHSGVHSRTSRSASANSASYAHGLDAVAAARASYRNPLDPRRSHASRAPPASSESSYGRLVASDESGVYSRLVVRRESAAEILPSASPYMLMYVCAPSLSGSSDELRKIENRTIKNFRSSVLYLLPSHSAE